RRRVVEYHHHGDQSRTQESQGRGVREGLRVVEGPRGGGQEQQARGRVLLGRGVEALGQRERRREQQAQPQEAGRVLAKRGRHRAHGEAEEQQRGGAERIDRQRLRAGAPLQQQVLVESRQQLAHAA